MESKQEWPAKVLPTIDAHYGDKMGLENQHINGGGIVHPVCMATGQGGAEIMEDKTPTLNCNHEAPIVCAYNIADRRAVCTEHENGTGCLTSKMGTEGNNVPIVNENFIRRLTPEECEAAQGFPKGYTKIPWRRVKTKVYDFELEMEVEGASYESELEERDKHLAGPEEFTCPDGPRYKALGNSWAVPVAAWIGRRIKEVDKSCQK